MSGAAIVRASSLGALLDCAHRWEGIHLLGMSGRTSGAAWLGTSLHAATAAYDLNRDTMLVREATEFFRDHLQGEAAKAADVQWTDLSPTQAKNVGVPLVQEYCFQWSPHFEFLAVEMTLEPQTIGVDLSRYKLGPVDITFTGSMDRARVIRQSNRAAAVADVKSGKRVITDGVASTKGHAAQTGVYTMLAEMDGRIPYPLSGTPSIIALSTAGGSGPKIATADMPTAREQLMGTATEPGLIEYAGLYLKTGLFPPNPRSSLCSETYCPRWETCRYRG